MDVVELVSEGLKTMKNCSRCGAMYVQGEPCFNCGHMNETLKCQICGKMTNTLFTKWFRGKITQKMCAECLHEIESICLT